MYYSKPAIIFRSFLTGSLISLIAILACTGLMTLLWQLDFVGAIDFGFAINTTSGETLSQSQKEEATGQRFQLQLFFLKLQIAAFILTMPALSFGCFIKLRRHPGKLLGVQPAANED